MRVASLCLAAACSAWSWSPLPALSRPPRPPLRASIRMADSFVLERLAGIKESFLEMTEQLEDPEVQSNTEELLRITRERAKLEDTVTAFEEYQRVQSDLVEAQATPPPPPPPPHPPPTPSPLSTRVLSLPMRHTRHLTVRICHT